MNILSVRDGIIGKAVSKVSVDANGCWIYQTSKKKNPAVKWDGINHSVRRLFYKSGVGPIEKNFLYFSCNDLCVNPHHAVQADDPSGRDLVPIEERFWERVQKGDRAEDCWMWTGKKSVRGYGELRDELGTSMRVHRYSYELHFGPIPDGMVICHHCDNPVCVNPAHLAMGTQADNVQDMFRKKRDNHAKGDHVNTAKLTESQVLEIRRRYKPHCRNGNSASALGREFGVASTCIDEIVHGRTWKHLLLANKTD